MKHQQLHENLDEQHHESFKDVLTNVELSQLSQLSQAVHGTMSAWPMAAASSRWGLAAFVAFGGVSWELRRSQGLARYREMKRRYSETGSETRFPFYGRDFGYEVDYMLELQLQPGDRCLASYSLEALPVTHAAVLTWKRTTRSFPPDHMDPTDLMDLMIMTSMKKQ